MATDSIGLTRQRTINCDYIVCSTEANVKEIAVDSANMRQLTVDTLVHEPLTELIMKVQNLTDRIGTLERNLSAGFVPGETVDGTLHFPSVDLTEMSPSEIANYEQNLKDLLAEQAGVSPDEVAIVSMEPTGSTSVNFSIRFKETDDAVQTEQIVEAKNNFVSFLNEPAAVDEALIAYGGGETEQVAQKGIASLEAQLLDIRRQIPGTGGGAVDFSKSTSLMIDNYKLNVNSNELHITRLDATTGQYTGGTLVVDS